MRSVVFIIYVNVINYFALIIYAKKRFNICKPIPLTNNRAEKIYLREKNNFAKDNIFTVKRLC